MNLIFRLIWSNVTESWVAVAETRRTRQKRNRSGLASAPLFLALVNGIGAAHAAPLDGQVATGIASISQAGSNTTIRQTSPTVSLNWAGFDIGAGEAVNFIQPSASAIALNRIGGNSASSILGKLNANGQVYLINPSGILFGQGAQINVGGLVASTLDLNGSMDGPRRKFSGSGMGSVINQGAINVSPGGYVVLQGNQVSNQGTISAQLGTVALAAGSAVTLSFGGDSLLGLQVDGSNVRALAENRNLLIAEGGQVIMTAGARDSLLAGVVKNDGIVEAHSLQDHQGVIVLSAAGPGSTVSAGGRLDVSSASGKGGNLAIGANNIELSNATLDASGSTGGGRMTIGGSDMGQEVAGLVTADKVSIDAGTRLNADARHDGNGGQVVIWSNRQTDYDGSITARALGTSGNGGSAEVSAKGLLNYRGTTNLLAAHGVTGTLLLDPYDITISSGPSSNMGSSGANFTSNGDNSGLNIDTLLSTLSTANVTVATGAGGTQAGTITLAGPLAWTAATTLTLNAIGGITLNAPVTALAGGLTLSAGVGETIAGNNAIRVGTFTVNQGNWRQTQTVLPDFYAPRFNINSGGSFLRAAGGNGATWAPFILTDVYGLQGMGTDPMYRTLAYALGNHIDASITSGWAGGAGFVPLGSLATPFTGALDGRHYSISNLTINRPSLSTGTGLFGYVSNGAINDLMLLKANITGGSGANGILAGWITGSTTMNNIVTTGSVSGANTSGVDNIGGIVGAMTGTATLTGGSSAASVAGYFNNVGGAVGSVSSTNTVSTTSATGAVTGAVNTGGLIGRLDGVLDNAYATGAVVARTGGSNTGGLVGNNAGSLAHAYSTGSVTGSATAAGGFVGQNSGVINTSYWNNVTSGKAAGSGANTGTINLLTGQDSTAMRTQSSYAGWDFAGTWALVTGYNPTLRAGTTILLGGAGNQTISGTVDSATNINVTSLQNFLGGGNVLVNAGSGTLTVQNALSWSSSSTLDLFANGTLSVASGANLSALGAGAGLDLLSMNGGISITGATLSTTSGKLSLSASNSGATTAVALANATLNSSSGIVAIQGAGTSGAGITLTGANSLTAGGGAAIDGRSFTANGILMNTGATLTSTGNVILTGKSTDSASTAASVRLTNNNTITSTAGDFQLNGGDQTDVGVGIAGTGTLTLSNTGSGVMTLNGVSRLNNGIDITGGATLTTSSSTGRVNLTGRAVDAGKDINISTTGNILLGRGTLFGDAGRGMSVVTSGGTLGLNDTVITTNNGDLTVTAASKTLTLNTTTISTGVGNATLSGNVATGNAIVVSGANSFSSNPGSVTLNGTATGSGRGIQFNSGSSVTSAGTTTLRGQSSSGTGVGFCAGSCVAPVSFTATSGNLSILGSSVTLTGVDMFGESFTNTGAGTLSLSGTSTSGTGIYMTASSSAWNNAGSGTLAISGTSTSGAGVQVNVNKTITSAGTVSLTGTSDSANGLNSLTGNSFTSTSGDLTIAGVSNATTGLNLRNSNTFVNSGGGTLRINGTSTIQNGIVSQGSISTSGNTIVTGTGGVGSVAGTTARGVDDTASWSILSGNLSLIGYSEPYIGIRSTGTTYNNQGNGTVTISGTGIGPNTDHSGIYFRNAVGLLNAGTGSIRIDGHAVGGKGVNFNEGAALTTTGTVALTGHSDNFVGVLLPNGALNVGPGSLSISGSSGSAINAGVYFAGDLAITNNSASTLTISGANSNVAGTAVAVGQGYTVTSSGDVLLTDAASSAAGTAIDVAGTLSSNAGSLRIASLSGHDIRVSSGAALGSTGGGNLALATTLGGAINNEGSISLQGTGALTLETVDGDVRNTGLISGGVNAGSISLRTSGSGSIDNASGQLVQDGTGAISLRATGTGNIASDTILYTNAAANTLEIAGTREVRVFNTITSNGGSLDTSIRSTGGALALGTTVVTGNGALALVGPVTLAGDTSLDAGSGTITAASAIDGGYNFSASAHRLVLNGALGASTALADVTLLSQESLTLPSVTASSLLARASDAGADLTLAAGSVLRTTGTGDAITLAAGRNFINRSGSGALSTGPAGRWLVYSSSPEGNVYNQLDSGNTAVWDSAYGSGMTAEGNRYAFAFRPTLTFSSADARKTEGVDGSAALASSYVVSGLQAGVTGAYLGDTLAQASSGSPLLSSAGTPAAATAAAGPYDILLEQGSLRVMNGYALSLQSGGKLTLVSAAVPEPVPGTGAGSLPEPGGNGASPGDALAATLPITFENRYLPTAIVADSLARNERARDQGQPVLCFSEKMDGDALLQSRRCSSAGK